MSRFSFGFVSGAAEIPVPGNDAFTKVLLHLDGANGSTTFTDSNAGGSAHSWSASGSAALTTTHKYGSAALSPAGGYIRTGYSGDFVAGSSDFTIDFWMNALGNVPSVSYDLLAYRAPTTNAQAFGLTVSFTGSLAASIETTTAASINSNYSASPALTVGWHHIAYVRNGTSLTVYVDGVAGGTVGTTSLGVLDQNTFQFTVGSKVSTGTDTPFPGLIDEVRLSIGIARWTSNFTPPTGPYN